MLFWSQRLAIAGLTLLALAMSSAVFLVGDFVFNSTVAALGAAATALVITVLWYVVPLLPPAGER